MGGTQADGVWPEHQAGERPGSCDVAGIRRPGSRDCRWGPRFNVRGKEVNLVWVRDRTEPRLHPCRFFESRTAHSARMPTVWRQASSGIPPPSFG